VAVRASGYTLLMVGAPNAITATVYDKLNYDFIRDNRAGREHHARAFVMVVDPSVSANTVPEFIACSKCRVVHHSKIGRVWQSWVNRDWAGQDAGPAMSAMPR
jgi:hypothetical protein